VAICQSMREDAMADEKALSASRLAEQAMLAMQTRGIPPTPENFAVWYLHQSGSNPALGRAIANIDKTEKGFTAERSAELHRHYGGSAEDSRHLLQVSDRVGSLVDEVTRKLGLASSQTRDYSERLSSLGHGIGSLIDPTEIVALVRELENQTELMRQRAGKLEVELERNSREINDLKGDLENARRAATTDPLTGLGNRKLFDEAFAEEAEEALATGTPLSLLVTDIDHFKLFNDRHGHQIGDAVLKLVADRLKRSVKGRDTVARFGGEEFVVLLPRTNEAAAAGLADQLRAEIAKSRLVVRNRGQDLGKVTISIGVAEYRPSETPDECFKRADQALYSAKHAGRNRVMVASQVAAEAPEVAAA
jgi:diguanylate cyclase